MVDEIDTKLKMLFDNEDVGLFVNYSKHKQLTKKNDDDAAQDVCATLKGEGIETRIYGPNGMTIVTDVDEITIPAGGRAAIQAQIAVKVPCDCYGQLASRSGLARDYGITIEGGVIDIPYRGVVGILVFNQGFEPFVVKDGMRIAQFITVKINLKRYLEVPSLDTTTRGSDGFGKSGLF